LLLLFIYLQLAQDFKPIKSAPAMGSKGGNPAAKDFNSAVSLQSGDPLNPTPYWDVGVTGANQYVQISDTGFDDASCLLRDGPKNGLSGDLNPTLQVRPGAKAPVVMLCHK
jgi:hypothetical protein